MTAVGQEFWIVAAGCAKDASVQQEKDVFFEQLKSNKYVVAKPGSDAGGPWRFNVPDGDRSLMFGSFDQLIRLTDDLQKNDSQLDSIVHRFERQLIEFDPKADFQVKSQRQVRTLEEYMKNWQWDEAKYPRTRSIADNLNMLMQVVGKLDEECRAKTAQYNETKTSRSNMAKKDGANLVGRDLVDVLTPDVVSQKGTAADHFIYTEHLTTIVVMLPRGGEADFLKTYDTKEFGEDCFGKVVPMSAQKFEGVGDKDGNTLWRVVVFKSGVEAFRKACRTNKVMARDFEYSEDAYGKLVANREAVEEALKKQLERVRGLFQAAWSDAMVAWMHVKAMRVFVESVLRFGMPPRFAAFIIQPKAGSPQNLRKALADILGKGAPVTEVAGGDDEEYYPYVSFSFVPFTANRA